MRFTKMQAAGNDYVYMDTLKAPISSPEALARRISDRHFGVGSDGLILICPPSDPGEADFRMRMFNADGSEAEMCGNGIRCVGKYVYDNGHTDKEQVRIETLAGVLTLRLHVSGGKVETVTVDMGEPRLAPKDIPVSGPGEDFINRPLRYRAASGTSRRFRWAIRTPSFSCRASTTWIYPVSGRSLSIILVSPAHEHRVRGGRREASFEDAGLGARRGRNPCLRHGACASVVAAVLTGNTERKVRMKLLGGELDIEWDEATNHVFMTGGAVTVFTGEWLG